MTNEFEEYARYFHEGLRVEIGIPVSREEVFRDWAIVTNYREDLLGVELSRDQLPQRVRITHGSILDVGVWRGAEVFTCRGIVTEKEGARLLTLRLLGAVTLKDRRQFYRLNVPMRLKFALPDPKMTKWQVEKEWEERRQREMDAFQARLGEYDAVLEPVLLRQRAPSTLPALTWHDCPDIRAVIGGGGIGFKMPRQLELGELVCLELHIPLYPFRIVHAVAEVVYVLEPFKLATEPAFHTGLKFYHLDERDRNHIFEFISQAELERLREMSDRRRVRPSDEARLDQDVAKADVRQRSNNVLFLLIVLLVLSLLLAYLVLYKSKNPDNEIGRQFRDSLTK